MKPLQTARLIATSMKKAEIISSILIGAWLVVVMVRAPLASAGPVTGGGGNAPFVKLGVYQGVITIAPSAANVMEVGNLGKDIASSTAIYLRPSSVPAKICIGGSNPGTSCPNGNECLGGGLCSNTAPRVYKYPTYPEAALDLDGGQLCLHGTGVYDCRNVWPAAGGAGDTNWTTAVVGSMTDLTPLSGATIIDTIQVGSSTNPVPGANGYGLDVETNVNAPAVNLPGTFVTGYYNSGLGDYVGGAVNVNGKVIGQLDTFTVYSNGGGITPYNASDVYNRTYNETTGIDADTFDGTTSLLFPTNGNLFWKFSTGTGNHICLRTSTSYMCLGGTATSNAGTPCPNAGNNGPDQTKCNNGATCTGLCGTSDAMCPADPTMSQPNSGICFNSQRCVGGSRNGLFCDRSSTDPSQICPGGSCQGRACNNSYDCRVNPPFESNDVCIHGYFISISGGTNNFCVGAGLTCQDACTFRYKQTCDGTAGAGTCSSFGTGVRYDTGQDAYIDNAYGNCQPPGQFGPNNWVLECDCTLSSATPYTQAKPPGNGGDLCTKRFTNI